VYTERHNYCIESVNGELMKSEKPPVQSGQLRHHHLTKRRPSLRHKRRPTQNKIEVNCNILTLKKYIVTDTL